MTKFYTLASMKKKIVVFTGAGISAESGISTFRDSNGLWENYNIEDVATPEAWHKNPTLVLDFYNQRRKQVLNAQPNKGHFALVELEKNFDVHVVTQNVDDLHERAGSSNVLHLHGEIRKGRSTFDPNIVVDIEGHELNIGDTCERGSQLRPHIVWFGEMVPEMENAYRIASQADIFIIVGTSMAVYPAAGLIEYTQRDIPIYLVDPNDVSVNRYKNIIVLKEKASIGLPLLIQELFQAPL